jgi:hypothetical protein
MKVTADQAIDPVAEYEAAARRAWIDRADSEAYHLSHNENRHPAYRIVTP